MALILQAVKERGADDYGFRLSYTLSRLKNDTDDINFRAANAMLWEGRLSPAFWADALAYSQFLFNRAPNDHIGSSTTPWTMLTGEKPRWDKLRVFGCDCFEHIPNNEYYKVPGIPRGRRLIFVGFGLDMDGWRCFA